MACIAQISDFLRHGTNIDGANPPETASFQKLARSLLLSRHAVETRPARIGSDEVTTRIANVQHMFLAAFTAVLISTAMLSAAIAPAVAPLAA